MRSVVKAGVHVFLIAGYIAVAAGLMFYIEHNPKVAVVEVTRAMANE